MAGLTCPESDVYGFDVGVDCVHLWVKMHINLNGGQNVKVELGYFLTCIPRKQSQIVKSERNFCSSIILSNGFC